METKIFEAVSEHGNVLVVEAENKYAVLDIARHYFGVNDPVASIAESTPLDLHCFQEHSYEGK